MGAFYATTVTVVLLIVKKYSTSKVVGIGYQVADTATLAFSSWWKVVAEAAEMSSPSLPSSHQFSNGVG